MLTHQLQLVMQHTLSVDSNKVYHPNTWDNMTAQLQCIRQDYNGCHQCHCFTCLINYLMNFPLDTIMDMSAMPPPLGSAP